MTDEQKLIWAAGFFDGEGCISVTSNQRALSLRVSQLDRAPLDRLVEVLGGKVYGPYTNRRLRPLFVWSLTSSQKVELALLRLLPYLTCKHAQAELAIGFPTNKGNPKLLDEVRIERFIIDSGLRALKHP